MELTEDPGYAVASISTGESMDVFVALQSTSPLRIPYLVLGVVLLVAVIVDLL